MACLGLAAAVARRQGGTSAAAAERRRAPWSGRRPRRAPRAGPRPAGERRGGRAGPRGSLPAAGRPGFAAARELPGPSLHCAALIRLHPWSGEAGPCGPGHPGPDVPRSRGRRRFPAPEAAAAGGRRAGPERSGSGGSGVAGPSPRAGRCPGARLVVHGGRAGRCGGLTRPGPGRTREQIPAPPRRWALRSCVSCAVRGRPRVWSQGTAM